MKQWIKNLVSVYALFLGVVALLGISFLPTAFVAWLGYHFFGEIGMVVGLFSSLPLTMITALYLVAFVRKPILSILKQL